VIRRKNLHCSAAAEHAGAGPKGEQLAALSLFKGIMASLKIVDYGLFGGSSSIGTTAAT
jgi:hypothetical protein